MALDRYPSAMPFSLAFRMRWGAREHRLSFDRWTGAVVVALVPLLASWSVAATLYFVFHDQFMAALLARQSDMQYSYEDRIADLRTKLDRETSQGLLDRRTLDTNVRALMAQADRLEERAVTIDGLLKPGADKPLASLERTRAPSAAPTAPVGLSAFDNPPPAPSVTPRSGLRLSAPKAPAKPDQPDSDQSDPDEDVTVRGRAGQGHAELSPADTLGHVAAVLARVEGAQGATVARLREPMIQSVRALRSALDETGLPLGRWGVASSRGGVGGPFVPLPSGVDFDQTVALLRDAASQRARLQAIVDRVPLRKPLEGPIEVTSTFGARLDPFFGRPAMHTGIDLHETDGDQVEATAAGTITVAGSEGGYGNMVEIDHGNGLATRYAHMSSINVVVHQRVAVGTVVGRVGSTGRATGPHLHYETRINGEPVDPARFLRAGSGLFKDRSGGTIASAL